MQPNIQSRWTTAMLVVGALAAGMLLVQQPARSYQPREKVEWEYRSVSVDADALATKIIEMGTEGWEIFSVVASEKTVETGDGDPPRIVTDRYEVTARRPSRQ